MALMVKLMFYKYKYIKEGKKSILQGKKLYFTSNNSPWGTCPRKGWVKAAAAAAVSGKEAAATKDTKWKARTKARTRASEQASKHVAVKMKHDRERDFTKARVVDRECEKMSAVVRGTVTVCERESKVNIHILCDVQKQDIERERGRGFFPQKKDACLTDMTKHGSSSIVKRERERLIVRNNEELKTCLKGVCGMRACLGVWERDPWSSLVEGYEGLYEPNW